MNTKLLVAYASKHGATKEIAEKVGEMLRQGGLQADVLPVEQIRDVGPYQAVILGSAVYIGKWMKSACDFVKKHEVTLAQRPVWVFSSGPTGEGDPVALLDGWRLPEDQKPVIDRIHPREIVVFHGNIDPEHVNLIERTAVKAIKKPFGDFRDWNAVTSWALSVAQVLKHEAPALA